MSMATTISFSGAAPEPIWRLSVRQYHDMIRTGILTDDDPVELLEGLLVTKMPRNPPHRVATRLTRDALQAVAPANWHVEAQEPITTESSEPEPDIAVIRGSPRQYSQRHPTPADLGLVGEIADTSLERDRGPKKRIYARGGIPVYWIVNLVENQVEVYTEPTGPHENPDYLRRTDYRPGECVPVVLDGRELAQLEVEQLLR